MSPLENVNEGIFNSWRKLSCWDATKLYLTRWWMHYIPVKASLTMMWTCQKQQWIILPSSIHLHPLSLQNINPWSCQVRSDATWEDCHQELSHYRSARQRQRGCVWLLPRALPGHHLHDQAPEEDPLLLLQPDRALSAHFLHGGPGLHAAPGLRGKIVSW